MNSTGSNSHQLLDYNRFIGPNSPVDIHIQRAIQVVEKHDSLPYCQKMAASSLIHSCATLQGKTTDEEETQGTSQDMNATLGEEKTLYAARLAVCELSDSKVPVPKQCTSFIPTRETTKKTGWFGYLPVPGVWKSIVRYPDYEQATKRDRDACVQALYASNQAWHSYSNAGQDAVKLCHAVRGDIERDQELQMYRGLTENVANVAEAMHHMEETIRIQDEAMDHLVIRTQQLTEDLLRDLPELREMYRQTVVDLTDGVQLVATKVSEANSALDAHNSDIRASGEQFQSLAAAAGSHLSELVEQHTANVDVAFQDAANSHQRVKFANELFMQQLIQHQDDMLSNAYQVEALAAGAVRTLDIVNSQGADLRDTVEALSQALSSVNSELRDTQDSVAALRSDVLVIAGHVSAIVGTIAGAFAHLPTIVWYLCSFGLIAGTLVFFMLCPGGLWTIQVVAGLVIRCFESIILLPTGLFQLVESTCIIPGEDIPAILAIAGVTAYCTMFDSPINAVERWRNNGPSPAEATLVGFVTVCLFFFLVSLLFSLLRRDITPCDERGEHALEDAIQDEKEAQPQPRSRYETGSNDATGDPGIRFKYDVRRNERKGFWFNDPKAVRGLSSY
jgi:uncharacterized protein YoxC